MQWHHGDGSNEQISTFASGPAMICDHSQIEEAEVIVPIDSEQHTLLEGGIVPKSHSGAYTKERFRIHLNLLHLT